ncbi:uncharacterized protein LOC116850199 [Odontomachus brunneus]|uniref:uncharacterized protein LOC116850199 n=1 Tax=Odontomachus brunneus TaxID=486640 RepID=UPI0013F25870|nr:uncharacterized protein LOC116850199 [Odontomachus brunneus]
MKETVFCFSGVCGSIARIATIPMCTDAVQEDSDSVELEDLSVANVPDSEFGEPQIEKKKNTNATIENNDFIDLTEFAAVSRRQPRSRCVQMPHRRIRFGQRRVGPQVGSFFLILSCRNSQRSSCQKLRSDILCQY